MPDEAVKKQIEGVCEEISEKNGWTAFHINVGSQYPVRLQTKLPALVEKGRAVGQQRAVWTFKESQGNENPNKPGTYYMNRYFEDVEVGGHVDPEKDATPAPSRNGGSRTGATDRSIERQVIIKEMVQHHPYVRGDMNEAAWWALMAALDAFMVDGVPAAVPEVAVDDGIPFE